MFLLQQNQCQRYIMRSHGKAVPGVATRFLRTGSILLMLDKRDQDEQFVLTPLFQIDSAVTYHEYLSRKNLLHCENKNYSRRISLVIDQHSRWNHAQYSSQGF